MNIAALNPPTFCEALLKSRQALLSFRIILGKGDQRADAPCRVRLSAGRKRQSDRRATEKGDDLAPLHCRSHAQMSYVSVKIISLKGRSMSALGQKQTSLGIK